MATKVCEFLTEKKKTYQAVLLLGKVTDTQDISGTVLSEGAVTCSREEAQAAVLSFLGEYDQIPPMYSALKVNGKKLYELARAGVEVERKARKVFIEDIQIESIEMPRIRFQVTCSKGTYVRTLCHDIGQKLGCGGCMEELVRTRVSDFCIEESLTLAQIEKRMAENRLLEKVLPVEACFRNFPARSTRPDFDKLLYNGNPVWEKQLAAVDSEAKREARAEMERFGYGNGITDEPEDVRMYDSQGRFIGIYMSAGEGRWKPKKMFYSEGGAK